MLVTVRVWEDGLAFWFLLLLPPPPSLPATSAQVPSGGATGGLPIPLETIGAGAAVLAALCAVLYVCFIMSGESKKSKRETELAKRRKKPFRMVSETQVDEKIPVAENVMWNENVMAKKAHP